MTGDAKEFVELQRLVKAITKLANAQTRIAKAAERSNELNEQMVANQRVMAEGSAMLEKMLVDNDEQ